MCGLKVVSVILCSLYLVEGNVIVETKSGKVAGVEVPSILKDEKFYSFFSIPYGEAPVGKLRFMPPRPHPGWSDVLENKKERKPCAHFNLPMISLKEYGFSGEEDCLHLSVHTPKLPANDNPALPVIVFLYNENFKIAYNASKEYSPDFFMKEDVIIVTLQHRLGSLGFLSFEDDTLPGNNGLRDVILALNWIKINIQSFGGDPNKVTLMGSEGGAVITDLLLHSPKAKGLFHRAILHSGTSWASVFLGDSPRDRAILFSKELESHATTSSYLLKRLVPMDPVELTAAEDRSIHADEAREIQKGIIAFGPIVEHDHPDAIITQYPESKATIELDVPVMIGYTSREGMRFCDRYLQKPQYLTFADRDFVFIFPRRVNYSFELNTNTYYESMQDIKDFYFKDGYIKVSKPGEYMTYVGDIHTIYPIDYTVRKYTNNTNNKVYYYSFDYSGDFNFYKKSALEDAVTIDGTWGAMTRDELCYLFVCKPLKKVYKKALEEEDSEEMKVLRNMIRLWTNFAKTGNPTPPGEKVEWKPASIENKECMVISEELNMKTNLHEERITYWDNFIEVHEKLAVNGKVRGTKDEL